MKKKNPELPKPEEKLPALEEIAVPPPKKEKPQKKKKPNINWFGD